MATGGAIAPAPPGRAAPLKPAASQLEAVRQLVLQQVAAIEGLEPAALRSLLPILKDAQEELRRGLAAWLRGVPDGAERFTAQQLRAALRQIDAAIEAARRLEPALVKSLKFARERTGELAASNLETEVARFGAIFGESIRPVQIDTAAVVAKGDRLLYRKHRTSAARYAGAVGDDIRRQLAVGLARGETFAQLKARLVRHGGPAGRVFLRGREGDPDAIAELISEGLFKRYRWWAERLVRTELMAAYNAQHQAGIDLLNDTLRPGEEPFVRRWDAAADRRVCPVCRGLDRRVARIGELFWGGYDHPPAHPCCRCVEVAWHPSWGDIEGEAPVKGRLPRARGPALPPPAPPPAPPPPPAAKPRRAAPRPPRVVEVSPTAAAARGDLPAARRQVQADMAARYGLWAKPQPLDDVGVKRGLRADGQYVRGYRDWDGRIMLDEKVAKGVRALARRAIGKLRSTFQAIATRGPGALFDLRRFSFQELEGTRTLAHEIAHGFGPLGPRGYRGAGLIVEEVSTEVMARRYMIDAFGIPRHMWYSGMPGAGPFSPMGSYQAYVDGMLQALRTELLGGAYPTVAELEAAQATAVDALEAASAKFRSLSGSLNDPDDVVDAFVDAFPRDLRNAVRTHLENQTP